MLSSADADLYCEALRDVHSASSAWLAVLSTSVVLA